MVDELIIIGVYKEFDLSILFDENELGVVKVGDKGGKGGSKGGVDVRWKETLNAKRQQGVKVP